MRLRKSICVILSLIISACTSLTPPSLQITLKSQPSLNPDEHGRPLAVVVRVYQLMDDERFQSASFSDLWKHDKRVLGDQLLRSQEWVIIPGQTKSLRIIKRPESQMMGVVVLFRRPDHAIWRVVRPMKSSFTINLSGNRVEVVR